MGKIASVVVLGTLGSLAAAATVLAEPAKIKIDHRPIACVLAGQNPRIDARFTPDQDVASARLKFRTDQRWYAVPLETVAGRAVAVLPQPKGGLDRFEYRIEVIGLEADVVESPATTVRVVKDAADCGGGKIAATATPEKSLLVDMPPGSTKNTRLVPDGFSPDGVAGDIGVFDFGPKTALVGATAAGAGALVFLRNRSTAPLAPPEHAVISFLGSEPPPGSSFSAASTVITFRLRIVTNSDNLVPGSLAVDFNACTEVRVPFAGLAANTTADLEVSGRLQPYACFLPTFTGRLFYSAYDANGKAQVFAQTEVSPRYNVTP